MKFTSVICELQEKERKRIFLKKYQNSNDNTNGSISNISTRRIQWYQIKSSSVTETGHISILKQVSKLSWITYLTHYVYLLWPYLVLLHLLSWVFSRGIDGDIINAIMWPQCHFFLHFFFCLLMMTTLLVLFKKSLQDKSNDIIKDYKQ